MKTLVTARRALLGASCLCSAIYYPAQADVQTDSDLTDIVVTAQKREQSINDVGLTIQAATADTLAERGVTSPSDLGKLVPGFTYTQSTFVTPVFTLRGIGLYDASIGSPPSVAVYTDQIPRNFPVMSDALELDLERVEVLKGPQGTVFGQSATGGAINYITAKPTDSFEAGLDASYERFGKADIAGFVSGPLTDSLKARLAVRAINGGAWQYSISRPDDKNGDTRKIMGRLTLDWEASDSARFEASVTGARDRSDTQAPQYAGSFFNIYSAAALAAANADPATANPFGYVDEQLYFNISTPGAPGYDNSFLGRQDTAVRRMNDPDPVNAASAAGARALLGTPVRKGSARAADWTEGLLKRSDNNYVQATLRADFDLTDDITLTSLSAYARSHIDYAVDLDGTAATSINVPVFGKIRTFNQELRLSGKSGGLQWMIGGNYDDAKTSNNNYYQLIDYTGNQPIPGIGRINLTLNEFDTTLKTYAAFANLEYELTPRLTVNGGIRYTKNKQTGTYCYNDPATDAGQTTAQVFSILQTVFTGDPTLPAIQPDECFPLGDGQNGTTFGLPTRTPVTRSLSQDNVSFRVGVNYKSDGGALLYGTVSQGYKTGVFSNIGATSVSQYSPAVQEKVIAYEAGFKAPLFDRRVQFNGAAFYYDYSDKQIRAKVFDQGPFGLLEKLINVPKSYIWGLEGELSARPADGLTLNASATYLKSKVSRSFSQTSAGEPVYNTMGYTGDLKGAELPYTPNFSANADIQYEWDIGSDLRPFIGGTVFYQGRQNAMLRADFFNIPSYTTVDVRAGIGAQDQSWKLTAYGRNIFNKYYIVSPTFYHDAYFNMTGRPAIYGIALKLRMK